MKAKKHRNAVRLISLFLSIVTLPHLAIFGFAEEVQPSATRTSPQAYFFTYNNGSNYNSRLIASNNVFSNLWDLGFSTGEYLNNYATTIFSVIKNKEVTVITGNGFWCETYLPGQSTTTRIFADEYYNDVEGAYSVESNDVVISQLARDTSNDKTSNLVIIAARFSAYTPPMMETPTMGYYSPMSVATAMRSRITDCAIGWTNRIVSDSPEMALWLELFFEGCNYGRTITSARDYANDWLDYEVENGDEAYDGSNAWDIYTYVYIVGAMNRYIDD